MSEKIPLPPSDAEGLSSFPSYVLPKGTEIWRVHRAVNGPWYFGPSGRFGLASPAGTCYAALDPLTAISETVIRGQVVIDEDVLTERIIRSAGTPIRVVAADLVDRRAQGFGVNRNFGTEEPYDRTQQWAQAFHLKRFRGVRYWARHDLQADATSVAIFGASGERKSWPRGNGGSLGSAHWKDRISRELGVSVRTDPHDAELVFVALP